MSSLSSCIKKAGPALAQADKDTILSRASELRDGGMGAQEAAIKAVDELMASVQAMIDAASAPKAAASANTIFTEDAAAAARARLKAKLGRLNSGLDPETMMDGITLAGYHIEKGARKFAAFARAMVDDLGDGVKPYLQSWYMAVRGDPRAADMRADMDKASAVEDLDVDEVLAATPASDPAATPETAIEQPQADEDVTMSGDVLMHAEPEALDALMAKGVSDFVDGESQRDAAMFGQQPKRVSLPRAKGDGKGGPLQLPAGVEVMTPEQAKAKLDEWKAEAARQGSGAESNYKYGVLSLFDTTGMMAQPWIDAGYTVYTYDLQDGQDINEFDAQNLLEQHGNDNIMVVIAQPPCTDFASSGAQWWKDKDADGRTEASNELVRQTLRTVELFRPAVWAMENPVGRIAKLNKLPEPTAAFDPWHFGDDYTKRTQFFGRFNPDMPTAPVFPNRGSIIHKMSSSAQKERSDTPEGIAYAFFMANNFASMGPAGRLAAEFAGVERPLFDAALASGAGESVVREAIEDSYYENDLEAVRDELRALAEQSAPDFTSSTPPRFKDYSSDRERYLRDRIMWDLQPGNYGGNLTLDRLAGIEGDPEKSGSTIPPGEIAAAVNSLVADGKIKKIPRSGYVLATGSGATTGPDTPAAPVKGDNQGQEATDERPLQDEGAQALDGMAAAEGGGAEGGGRTGRGAAGGRQRGARKGGRTDGAGVSTPRGRGSRATGVHPAEAGTQGAGDTGATGRTRRKGKGAPQVDAVDDLFAGPAEPAVPAAPQIPASNFRITPDLKLGEGGEAEKFRDNLAAIRALKAIEGDNRRATAAEQRILARYVGWGGIPNAFPHPQTKQFKPEWKARGEELQGLLSPPEHRRASNSTTDAHFTSETVTTAVWDAVKRLGFKGGLSLEMSLGSGNFIGLMPDDVAGRTRFIGVELDSITARIARALYPQSTVLESGMQYVPLATNAFDLDIGNPPFGSTSLTWQYSPSVRGLSIHNQFFVAGLNALKPGGIQAKVVSRFLMDAEDSTTREMLAVKGKLLGAIRLPETAFKTNARTEVVTDIVFIQRREKFEEEDVQQALWWLKAPLSRADYNKLDAPGKERYERLTNKYRDELQWVATSKVRDPLGGEPMVVGRYFAQNPGMVVGTMDRSGSMQHGADVTVKLAPGADFAAELAQRIQKLPEGVMDRSKEAIDAAIERHKTMADALEIAVSGQEPGQMVVGSDGKLMQVFERETPEGGYELGKREITATSPWSSQLFMDSEGRWYREVVKLGTDGKPIKQTKKDGSGPSNLNVKEREVFGADDKVPDTLRLGETRLDRLRDIAGLRDLLKRQLVLEAQDDSKAKMEANRTALAAAYEAYVAKHGYVSDTLTGALVNDMPDGALVQALELSFKPAVSKEKAAKTGDQPRAAMVKRAPIMSRRVVVPYAPPGKAESATDAMQISLAERGIIDVERIADLRGLTVDEAAAELTEGERPLAFRDPETGNLETRDAYLTGEVARKLRAARDAGLVRNAEALEAVQPEPITSDNVTVILGTSWVPSEVYAAFVTHITGEPAQVRFEPLTNTRMVTGKNTVKAQAWAARNAEGRVTVEATALLQDALNSQATKVSYKDSEGVPHLHKGDTELAEVKRKEIEREFAEWVFADGDRRRLLVEKFNEKFNTRVTRQHDGSHLMLPGKVPDEVISLRRHQKNAVWRGISERFMLLDHVVGAGKTYTAIARVMERRRMGLSRKPMIVVPNHMVEQFAADVYRLYPGAKVLAAGKKDFDKRARRRLFGKIATGDWDVVVVPHSSFQFIGLSPETEDAFLQEEMRQALKALKDAEADQESPRFKSIGVKKAEALVKKIEARLDAIKGANKDRLLTFEQMGVDDITVDEAHEFKNLFYSSRMENVRGMGDSSGSGKAFDLYTKVRYLRSTPTGSVVFMTGTPISNSAVEMFTMMRYLAADELRDLGLEHFDAWRTQFVDAGTAYEQQLTGGVKEVARLGRFWGNARSLMDLYYSFTDAVTIEDIKNAFAEDNPGKVFPVPRVKGGERQQVLVKPSPALVAKLTEIFDRYDALPDIEDVQERNAERLRLMDMARKASLDLRAVDKDTDSKEVGGKLDRVADEVARMHKLWTPDRGTQLVFLDRSVPKSKTDAAELKAYDKAIAARDKALADGKEDAYRDAVEDLEKFDSNAMAEMRAAQAGTWNAYQQIKDNLIARGVPANEIRFIQEANNDEQKQAMFDAVNAGEIRVLIGSTPRMGAGTNVQERLVGLHHVDVGWKPSDIEQREGRIVRQGNELLAKYGDTFEVEVLAYATERTADASLWALNGMKLKTINGIRKYDGSFTMEFEDEDSLSMAQMAALASGDPLLLERIELVGEIDKLERLENSHRRKLIGLRDRIEEAQRAIERAPGNIEANEKRAATVQAWEDRLRAAKDARSAEVEGKTYKGDSSHYDAARAALDAAKAQQGEDDKAKFAITINGKRITSKTGIENALMESFGDSNPFDATIFGEKQVTRAGAVRGIVEKARELAINLDAGQSEGFDIGDAMGLKLVGDVSRAGWGKSYSITFSLLDADGKTLSSVESRDGAATHDYSTQFVRATFDRLFTGSMGEAYSSSANYYRDDMKRRQAELPELQRQLDTSGEFKQAGELEEKRDRLAEVTRLLTAGGKDLQHIDDFGSLFKAFPQTIGQDDFGSQIDLDGGPAYSRSQGQQEPASDRRQAVEALVKQIASRWGNAPVVVVVDSMEDERVPKAVRDYEKAQQSKGASGAPEGFFFGGKVYLVAGQLGGDADVVRVLFHEFGHAGLRTLFGPQLSTILTRLAVLNASKVRSKAAQYGLDYDKPADRRAAAEEVLAEMAERNPTNGWVKQAVAAIRSFLRAHVPGFSKMRLSDAELVRTFVRPALDYVAGNPAMPVKTNRAQFLVDKGGADAKPFADGGIAEVLVEQGAQALNIDQRLEVMARVFGALQDLKVFEAVVGLDSVDVVNDIIDAKLTASGGRDNHAMLLERLAVKLNGPIADQVKVIDALFPAVQRAAKKLAPAEAGADGFFGVISAATTGAYKQLAADAAGKLNGRHVVTPTSDGLLGDGVASTASSPPSVSADAVEKDSAAFSRSIGDAVRDFSQQGARNAFMDAVTSHGSTNLWTRTVGTQYHKAKTNPTTFGPVFNAVQDYIKETSVFANQAADLAPSLLPKLDSWRDLVKDGITRHGADPVDTAKAGEAIFRGTLDKTLYSEETLASRFGLTPKQIALYREFRLAVDKSLDGLAKSEILRLAGDEGLPVRNAVLAAQSAEDAAELLNGHLTDMAEETGRDDLLGTVAKIRLKAQRIEQLKDEGYAPLTRFGKHTLTIMEPEGGVAYFGMYESVREANKAARLLGEDPEFAGMTFTQGVMSQEGHKLFAGLSLDALELFADATDNADNPVYQDYLKLALANRSAMKRMIERKGTKGYSDDVARVLASFVTSNARAAAGNLHLTGAKKAAEAIPKEQGDLRDDAINLVEYVTNPAEEAAAVRGLLFTTFIGGSVASALVNITQPITMTLPYLTQFGGAGKAAKRLLAAAAMVATGKVTGDMAAALRRAESDGIVSPQEIHHLQAEAMNSMGQNPYLKKAAFVWGSMFSLAEQFNRRVSFVAAYQTATEQGIANPFAFAEQAVVETQGLYNKGNKANWARGAVGATVMTFKQFSTHYLEFLTRMAKNGPEGRKAVAVALAILLLTAGAGGLPFADDLDDLIDTLGQAMGHDTNSKRWKRQFIAQTLGMGDTAAEVATRGLSSLPGMPIDLSLRMGMGNLLPATGLMLRSNTDTARQLLEVAGAGGGLLANVKDGATKALGGDVVGGTMTAMPVAIQNIAKAIQMWDTGEYRDKKGRKVMDVDAVDGAAKFLGFQPAAVARESSRVGETMRTVQLAKNVEAEIAGKWAQAMADGDKEAVAKARQELADWNAANPQAPIKITLPQVLRRLKELKTSRADRATKAAPKELRPLVREVLH